MDSLTISDRGDCCPAQARVLAAKGNLRLMFCYHHYKLHAENLLKDGWEIIIDDTADLLPKAVAKVH